MCSLFIVRVSGTSLLITTIVQVTYSRILPHLLYRCSAYIQGWRYFAHYLDLHGIYSRAASYQEKAVFCIATSQ